MTRVYAAACLAAAALWAAPAAGDTVKTKLPYEQVVVTDVADGAIQFRAAGGSVLTKPISEVSYVEINNAEDLNKAEKLFQEGKTAQAVEAYAEAMKSALGWKRALLRYRLMAACESAGQIDQAVRVWMEFCDESTTPAHLGLRPRKIAPAGNAANDKAIALLNDQIAKVKSGGYLREMRQLLVDLYERQGKLEQAQAVAALLAGSARPVATRTTTGAVEANSPPAVPPKGGDPQLRLAGLSLKSNQFAEVVGMLEPRLKSLAAADLPAALYYLGQAQLELARKETYAAARKDLLLKAGLNLMRVLANYSDSEFAPSALFSAGAVNELLGNAAAAERAYAEVVRRFGAGEAGKKASAALEALKGKPKS
jgi:tetratricopeptide (TPR) repeat protein